MCAFMLAKTIRRTKSLRAAKRWQLHQSLGIIAGSDKPDYEDYTQLEKSVTYNAKWRNSRNFNQNKIILSNNCCWNVKHTLHKCSNKFVQLIWILSQYKFAYEFETTQLLMYIQNI